MITSTGGVVGLRGNLAPEGAIVKGSRHGKINSMRDQLGFLTMKRKHIRQ